MKIEQVHFVEKFYVADSNGGTKYITIVEKLKERNPFVIESDGQAVGFRFFDVMQAEIDGELLTGARKNESNMFYFGKRKNEENTIVCDNGTIITPPDASDMTIKEAYDAALKEQESNILVERKPFFCGLAKVLSIFEPEEFVCYEEETSVDWDDDDDFCNDWGYSTDRTYTICFGKTELFSHTMMSACVRGTNGCIDSQKKDQDIFAHYQEINQLVAPLYNKYPYLSYFMENIKSTCFQNRGKITEVEILEMAREYAVCHFTLEKRCHILNKIITYTKPYHKD